MSEMILNAIYADGHFEREKIGELLNKGGAAGKIYKDLTHPQLVAKIFHEKNKSSTNRQKLEAMLHNRPNIPLGEYNGKTYVQIAWPVAILEDDEGFCVGYLMPLINTQEAVSLDHLMQKAVRKKVGLSERYIDRLSAAYNIAYMVAALHACKHYIVDLKPSNVSVYKDTMFVAVFDCDGFSICGEKGRYPAEFVSEEYIYPEGMTQNCEDMGEEQDKFALAVIIFKLLNNGIHPFSGTPRKNTDEMLPIQTRIEQYHYAYGVWPDTYQSPHPYSMHDYFSPKTLDLFDRAFYKQHIKSRPTAKEWLEHLNFLLQKENHKVCKKNPEHIYFIGKGCGLCAIEEKFKQNMAVVKEEKEMPGKIRGMDISELSPEKNELKKKEQQQELNRLRKFTLAGIAVYFLFFACLSYFLKPFQDILFKIGYFGQLLVIALIVRLLYVVGDKLVRLPFLSEPVILNALKIYAVCMLLWTFIFLNNIDGSFFTLAQ